MICRLSQTGDLLTARLDGEIDHHTARDIREQIDGEIDSCAPKTLSLDFRDISFMDSSGIGLIMGRYRKMQLLGGTVEVHNPSPGITKVLRLAGMDRLVRINESGVRS